MSQQRPCRFRKLCHARWDAGLPPMTWLVASGGSNGREVTSDAISDTGSNHARQLGCTVSIKADTPKPAVVGGFHPSSHGIHLATFDWRGQSKGRQCRVKHLAHAHDVECGDGLSSPFIGAVVDWSSLPKLATFCTLHRKKLLVHHPRLVQFPFTATSFRLPLLLKPSTIPSVHSFPQKSFLLELANCTSTSANSHDSVRADQIIVINPQPAKCRRKPIQP